MVSIVFQGVNLRGESAASGEAKCSQPEFVFSARKMMRIRVSLLTSHLPPTTLKVITSEAPAQAIELAMAAHFDLYLIDNWMPSMSGTDLCGALRLFDAETPILFYSAAAYPTDKAEAYACGAQGYLVKPADTDELVAEVFRLISESRAKRATA